MGFCGGACGSGRVAQAGPSAWGIHTLVPPPPLPICTCRATSPGPCPWALPAQWLRCVAEGSKAQRPQAYCPWLSGGLCQRPALKGAENPG